MVDPKQRFQTGVMKQLLRIATRYHLLSLSVAGAILALCLVQMPQMDDVARIPNIDKIVHFMMFFTFSLLFILEQWLVDAHWWKRSIALFLLAFVLTAFLGGVIEELQANATNYRSGDVMDWYFDMAGSGAAILLAGLYRLFGPVIKPLS